MQRTKWIERKFNFDFPEGWIYNILERLRGTPARIKEITHSLTEESVSLKPEGKWSIKEHIGHLSDLEELHEGRIEDFLMRKEILRAADMNNAKTLQANHNSKTIDQLLNDFIAARKKFVEHLERLNDETLQFKSKIKHKIQTEFIMYQSACRVIAVFSVT